MCRLLFAIEGLAGLCRQPPTAQVEETEAGQAYSTALR